MIRSIVIIILVELFSGLCPEELTDSLYALKTWNASGEEIALSRYMGRVVLLVNISLESRHRNQLASLEQLWRDYRSRGLVVLGVPSDDFLLRRVDRLRQDRPENASSYGVSFPVLAKSHIAGSEKSGLFCFLTASERPELRGEVRWYYEKFLVDGSGRLAARFGTYVQPSDSRIRKKIEELLSQKSRGK